MFSISSVILRVLRENKIQRKLVFFLANFNLRAEKNVVVRCMFFEQEMLLFVQFL